MIKLNEYRPKSRLELPGNGERTVSKFPVIDCHMHLRSTLFPPANNFNKYRTPRTPEMVYGSIEKFNIRHVVNLDGFPGEALDKQIEAYVDKWPGRFSIFTRIDYASIEEPGFAKWVDSHLAKYVERGVTGIKLAKDLSLKFKLKDGTYPMPDDDRLKPLWDGAAKYDLPVTIHIADPISFFDKEIDHTHERYNELAEHPSWLYGSYECPSFKQLLDAQENMLRKNPDTRFIIAHVGSYAENLKDVGRMLDAYPNMYTDTAERIAELGRQPYTSRKFLIKYQDRVLYGTDLIPNATNVSGNYRFFETDDEFFPYNSLDEHDQGLWNIYGVYLPDDVLKKIYYENTLRVAPRIKKMIGA